MILSQTAEYALRAMTHLAAQPSGVKLQSREISKETSVPAHYLSKIMRRMVESGLVTSQKGHGGGFSLAKPLSRIFIKNVFHAVNFDYQKESCAFGWIHCNSDKPCPLHHTWNTPKQAFIDWAENTTLQNIVREGGEQAPPL